MKKREKILATVVAVLLVVTLILWYLAEDVYNIHSDDTSGQLVTAVEISGDYPYEIRIDGKSVSITQLYEGKEVILTGIYAKCLFGDVINVIKTDYVVRVFDETGNLYWVWATNLGFEY